MEATGTTRRIPRLLAAGALMLLAAGAVVGRRPDPAAAGPRQEPGGTGPTEAEYAQPGPWGVATSVSDEYTIVHPTPLGSPDGDPTAPDSYRHPIITFGVGTWGHPSVYQHWLEHWASWGYVVVSPNIAHTGSGVEMWDGVQHLLAENENPASVFHEQLDPAKIAAGGHSQGAEGALWANYWSEGAISSVFTLSLPDPFFWRVHWTDEEWAGLIRFITEDILGQPPVPDFSFLPDLSREELLGLVDAPFLFLRPSEDEVFIEGVIEFPIGTEEGHVGFFGAAPGSAFKLSILGEGHSFDRGVPVSPPGLVAAWLDYVLVDDPAVCRMFREADGAAPELHGNPLLGLFDQKGLPECPPLAPDEEPFEECEAPCALEQVVEFDAAGAALTMQQAGSTVALGSVVLDGAPQPTGGVLNELTVTDRRGGGAGWSLTGQVTDFTPEAGLGGCPAGDDTTWDFRCIPGDNLGWASVAHDAVPGDVAQVTAGPATATGLGSTARSLCTSPATRSGGTSACGAALTLVTPVSAAAATYTATLTLTLA